MKLSNGTDIISSQYVSDYETVKRTWKERLFSKPWSPFKTHKQVYKPYVFKLNGLIIVSPATYARLKETECEK